MFDEIYKCPLGSLNPEACRCAACQFERQLNSSQAALDKAEQANFSRGSSISSVGNRYEMDTPKESVRDKVARQRRERIEQSDKDWDKLQNQKSLPNYLTGNPPPPQTEPIYPIYQNTRVSPDERVRNLLQSNNQDIMILSVSETFAYLQTEGWHQTKDTWVESTNSELGQVMVNYGMNGRDVVTTSMIISKLGDLGIKATVQINHLGNEIIVFTGWPNIRRILNAPRFRLDNPKVVDVGIGKYGLKNSIIDGARLTFYFAAAYRTVDFILNDETTLAKYIGSLATDAIKIGIASAVTWIAGTIAAGLTSFVAGPLIVVVVVGLFVSIGLNKLDSKFGLTDKVVEYIEKSQQEVVQKARELKDDVWDIGAMMIDGMLDIGKKVVEKEIVAYLRDSIRQLVPRNI